MLSGQTSNKLEFWNISVIPPPLYISILLPSASVKCEPPTELGGTLEPSSFSVKNPLMPRNKFIGT